MSIGYQIEFDTKIPECDADSTFNKVVKFVEDKISQRQHELEAQQ